VTFTIKRGATAPALSIAITSGGVALPLTGATAVFRMKNASGTTVIDAAALIETPASGVVEYQWADGDTDTAGVYTAEFHITLASGKLLVLPTDSFITVTIYADIAEESEA